MAAQMRRGLGFPFHQLYDVSTIAAPEGDSLAATPTTGKELVP